MLNMGLRSLACAWIAFGKLRGGFNHTGHQKLRLLSLGWFEGVGLFGSNEKRRRERIASSPYYFAVAYDVGGDPYVAGEMTHPDDFVPLLARKQGVSEESLITESQIDDATLQFNLDCGLNVLRRGANGLALQRLTLAAAQGSANAQFQLGRMYAEGRNALQDHMVAHYWLNLAVFRLSGADKDNAEKLRNAVAKTLPADRLMDAEQKAREWVRRTWQELSAQDPNIDKISTL